MDCLSRLRDIGIEQICIKTHISSEQIQDIIDMNFNAFDRVRAMGFTQIIERDFGVDMTEWFMAFCEYHETKEANDPEKKKAKKVGLFGVHNKEQNGDAKDNVSLPIETNKKDKTHIGLIAILALMVVLFAIFFIYNNFIISDNKNAVADMALLDKHTLTASQNTQQFIDANLSVLTEGSTPTESNQETIFKQNALDSLRLSLPKDTQNKTIAKNPDYGADISYDTLDSYQTKGYNLDESNSNRGTSLQYVEVTIVPDAPLWIGIIDLTKNTKQQFMAEENSTTKITLNSDKLIRTGHSEFSIKFGEMQKKHLGGNNKFYLYRLDTGMKEISKEEFLELNKGEEW